MTDPTTNTLYTKNPLITTPKKDTSTTQWFAVHIIVAVLVFCVILSITLLICGMKKIRRNAKTFQRLFSVESSQRSSSSDDASEENNSKCFNIIGNGGECTSLPKLWLTMLIYPSIYVVLDTRFS